MTRPVEISPTEWVALLPDGAPLHEDQKTYPCECAARAAVNSYLVEQHRAKVAANVVTGVQNLREHFGKHGHGMRRRA